MLPKVMRSWASSSGLTTALLAFFGFIDWGWTVPDLRRDGLCGRVACNEIGVHIALGASMGNVGVHEVGRRMRAELAKRREAGYLNIGT